MENKILIIGLGNDILSDDAIGPMLIRDIKKIHSDIPADFQTACCGGLEIIEIIKGYEKVILIDAMRTPEGIPGTVRHLTPENFVETLNLSNLHDINFIQALETSRLLGIGLPSEIHIIGVEIEEDRVFSEELTDTMKLRYPGVLKETAGIVDRITGRILPGL